MWPYVIKRLLLMVPTLIGVMSISFLIIQFVPGGPVEQMLMEQQNEGVQAGESGAGGGAYDARHGIDDRQVEHLTRLYGFDKPPFERYLTMMGKLLRFDLGESYFRKQGVADLILSRLPVSVSLGLWAFLISYLVSIPLGIAKAVRAGSRFDLVSSLVVLIGNALPSFVLGLILLVLLGGGTFWQIFPLRGLVSDNWDQLSTVGKALDYAWHITLPVTCMLAGSFAAITMLTRNLFLDEFHRQYVLTARAKGLSRQAVLWKHVFRNALLPLVTGFPAAFVAAFFTGSVLIETLFSLDGMGLLFFESAIRRDFPVVIGSVYLLTLVGLFTKLVSDVCYVLVDPRIQFNA